MRIATYGTFRKGERRGHVLQELRDRGTSEVMELPGLRMFVIGGVPGVVMTDDPTDTIVVELIEADLSKKEEKSAVTNFDQIEGVAWGLYARSYIDTPKGEAIIYTYAREPREVLEEKYTRINDWSKFQAGSYEEKMKASAKAGDMAIY